MAPELGKLGVATGHEPLPGIVGVGDLAEVGFIDRP